MKNKRTVAAVAVALLALYSGAVRAQDATEMQIEESVDRPFVMFEADPPISELTIDTTPVTRMAKGRQLLPQDKASSVLQSRSQIPYERIWSITNYQWTAPNLYHRPLYFEQVNLERYGHFHKNWQIESAISTAHFFGTIPLMPAKTLLSSPCDRVYTLGHHRPGNCNPNQHHASR